MMYPDKPKVSIICNTFNHERYIRKALDSFMQQKTRFPIEVLIHDDASTDGTAEIIREYEQLYPDIIKPIYQTNNQYSKRISISYTYQYPRARGEYIAFCEGDDFWTSVDKLQKQIDFLEEHHEYIGCVHRYIVVDECSNQKKVKTFAEYETAGRYTLQDFENEELPGQLATLVCRNIFLHGDKGYPLELTKIDLTGDIKLFLFLLVNGDIYRMQECYSAYRFISVKGGSSWSSRQLGKPLGYKSWCALNELERFVLQKYQVSINLEKRKISAGIRALKDSIRSKKLRDFRNAFVIIANQKGLLSALVEYIVRKINEK